MRRLPALLVLVLASFAALAKPLEPPKPTEKWTTLRVDEFQLVSNASPSATKAIAEDLVRMRDAVGQITRLKVRSSLPTKVFIFNNERAFAPYRDTLFERKMEHISGLFQGTESGNFILLRADSNSGVDRVVYHELTHYFISNTVPGLPVWLSEGLAEFYSTFRTSGKQIHIGRPIDAHVLYLRDQKLIPLRDLFAVKHNSPLYNESERSGVFYAQSWAVWHYLSLGNNAERRAQLPTFLSLLGKGKPVDEAFTAAFNTTYEKFEEELRKYVDRRMWTYSMYPLPEADVTNVPAPEPMKYDALLFELGHMLAHSGPGQARDAERFLNATVQANPNLAAAYADLGRVYDQTGRRDDARAAYERAVAIGSTDANVYVLAARSMVEHSQTAANLRKARELFQRAATIDPNSAKAWAGVGTTYLMTADNPADGIAALEKSLSLAPGDEEASVHLAQLYARADRFDEAIALAKRVAERTAHPTAAEFARDLLKRLEQESVRKMLTDTLNDAISKANAGKNAEALAIVEGILPKITDLDMLVHARALRDDLDARVKRKKK